MECYFDNSATTGAYPEVAEVMTKVMLEDYGNPSSRHQKGVDAEIPSYTELEVSVEKDINGLLEVAYAAKEMGVPFLRGGAFKPRTSPYDFQGLEEKGLEYLAKVREKTG